MDHSQRACGVIRHDQMEGLSPNATVGAVDRGERLQCHSVKIQKSSGEEGGLARQPRSPVNPAFPAIVSTNGRKKSPRVAGRFLGRVGKPSRLPNWRASSGNWPGSPRSGHLKKSRGVLCQGVAVKYRFIQAHAHEFRVARLCRALQVSRSGFYAW